MKEKAVFVCLSQQNFIESAQYPTVSASSLKADYFLNFSRLQKLILMYRYFYFFAYPITKEELNF